MCLYARPSEQSVEKHGHMADVIYLNTEALLAGKKSFHILHTNRRNTEQMVSIGTRHICSFEKLHSNESEAAVAIGSASYANAGLFISDVSYILFSSMQSSNENDSVANFSRTQS